MGVTSISIITLTDNVTLPDGTDGILQPRFYITWVGDTGPYDVLHEWDTVNTFDSGNLQTDSNTGIAHATSADTGIPTANMGPEGTTWYYQVTVTDTNDSMSLTEPSVGDHTILWKDYNDGTNVARWLYLPTNVGVKFVAGADGDPKDFDDWLYLLTNVDTTTPTPHIWYIAPVTQQTGNSITITGQGFGATQATFVSEIRLYDSPGTGGSFVTMTPSSWSDDELVASVPGGAATGYVTVVHTSPTPDLFSNQKLLTVTVTPPDRAAGWWAHISNLRNSVDSLKPLPNIAGGSIEYICIDQDIGNGSLVLQSDHPDLDTIVDPTASPPVSTLVKIYENARYVYSFYADDRSKPYTEDGAEKVKIFGDGLESCLKWGRALPYDHPNNPSRFPNWVWGSTDNILQNGKFDSFDDGNPIENHAGADGNDENGNAIGWSKRGSPTIVAVEDPFNSFTGDWYISVDPQGNHHTGAQQTFSCEPNSVYTFNAKVKESTAAGARITMSVSGASEGATDTGTYSNLFTYNGEFLCELDNVARNSANNGCPGGSSDGTWQDLDIEITTGADQTSITVTIQADHHPACSSPQNIEFWIGELVVSGFGANLDPWVAHDPTKHAAGSFVVRTDKPISGENTVEIDVTASSGGIRQVVEVVPGGRYTAQIQAFTDDTTVPVDENWTLQVREESTKTLISSQTIVPVGSGGVDQWQFSFDMPTTEAWIKENGNIDVRYIFYYSGPNNPDPIFASIAGLFPGDPASTPGVILNALIDAMQARTSAGTPGTLEFLQRSFTATLDSNGFAWASSIALEVRPADTLLQIVQRIQATGFEWEVQPQNFRAGGDTGIELSLYNDLGKGTNFANDREGPAILPSVASMSGNVRKGTQEVNKVYVQGAGGIWSSADSGDANLTALEQREEWIVNDRARDTTTTGNVAVTRLDDHENKGFSFQLNVSQNEDIRPNLDFLNGDTIRVLLPDDVPDDFYRVKAVTGTLTGEGTDMRHSLDFNRIDFEEGGARDRALKRALELLGAENISLGTGIVSNLPASGGVGTSGTSGGIAIGGTTGPTAAVTEHTHKLADDITGRATTGDVSGSVPGPLTVTGLRGRSVASDAPVNKDALVWNEELQRWEPDTTIQYTRHFLNGGM